MEARTGIAVGVVGLPGGWQATFNTRLPESNRWYGGRLITSRRQRNGGDEKMIDFEAAKREILEWVAETISVPMAKIDLDKPLAEIGLDSLDAVHMLATIESVIQQELPEDVIQRVGCLNDIFEMMRRRVAAA